MKIKVEKNGVKKIKTSATDPQIAKLIKNISMTLIEKNREAYRKLANK